MEDQKKFKVIKFDNQKKEKTDPQVIDEVIDIIAGILDLAEGGELDTFAFLYGGMDKDTGERYHSIAFRVDEKDNDWQIAKMVEVLAMEVLGIHTGKLDT